MLPFASSYFEARASRKLYNVAFALAGVEFQPGQRCISTRGSHSACTAFRLIDRSSSRGPPVKDQFGPHYAKMYKFRQVFKKTLAAVRTQYPAARLDMDGRGMTLVHSAPPCLEAECRRCLAAAKSTNPAARASGRIGFAFSIQLPCVVRTSQDLLSGFA